MVLIIAYFFLIYLMRNDMKQEEFQKYIDAFCEFKTREG